VNVKSANRQNVLILNLPNFDWRYQLHKQMGGGIGFKMLRHHSKWNSPNKIYPITDLLYAASLVDKVGHKVVVDDDQFRTSKDHESYLKSLKNAHNKPDFVFIRSSLPSLYSDINIVEKIKIIWPDTPFYVFGPLFSSEELVDHVKEKKLFDGIIISEIESVIIDIIEMQDFKFISGVYFLNSFGNYVCDEPTGKLVDMEKLPFLAYGLVDYKKIDRFIIQTSRGCPKACNYCPYYLSQGQKFRAMSPERVVDEMRNLYENFGARNILIHDAVFTLDRYRVVKLCELLIKEKLNIEWECETHMLHLDDELISLMYDAGNRKITFGVESANKEVLKRANRKFRNWDRINKNIRVCKTLGVKTTAFFILALPGETVKGVYATIKLARELAPDACHFNLPSLYPGTEAYSNALEEGYIDKNMPKEELYSLFSSHTPYNPSLSNNISDKQAHLLFCIANHSTRLNQSGILEKFVRQIKILLYKISIKVIDIFNKIKI
jgi:radical SAM superfamily enzyme YgiQ (UPF0313 family)